MADRDRSFAACKIAGFVHAGNNDMAKKKLTPEQGGTIGRMENENRYIDLAKHCIGLDRKKPYIRNGKKFYRPYRNFFAAGRNYEDWETIKDAGR